MTPEEFIESLDEAKLRCRDIGHLWRVSTTWHREHGLLGVRRILTCSSCKTKRTDIVSAGGHRIGQNYKHAPGYQFKGGGRGALARVDFRRASLERAGIELEEPTV